MLVNKVVMIMIFVMILVVIFLVVMIIVTPMRVWSFIQDVSNLLVLWGGGDLTTCIVVCGISLGYHMPSTFLMPTSEPPKP